MNKLAKLIESYTQKIKDLGEKQTPLVDSDFQEIINIMLKAIRAQNRIIRDLKTEIKHLRYQQLRSKFDNSP